MSFDTRHGYASVLVVLNILSLLSLEVAINNNGIIIATGYECFSVWRKVYVIDSTTILSKNFRHSKASGSAVNKLRSVKCLPCSADLELVCEQFMLFTCT